MARVGTRAHVACQPNQPHDARAQQHVFVAVVCISLDIRGRSYARKHLFASDRPNRECTWLPFYWRHPLHWCMRQVLVQSVLRLVLFCPLACTGTLNSPRNVLLGLTCPRATQQRCSDRSAVCLHLHPTRLCADPHRAFTQCLVRVRPMRLRVGVSTQSCASYCGSACLHDRAGASGAQLR
jgi:hypothetical protein